MGMHSFYKGEIRFFFQQNAHDNATDDAKISFYKQLPRVPYLTFLYHEELGQLICYLIDQ